MKTTTPGLTLVLLILAVAGLTLGVLILFTSALGASKTFAETAGASYLPFLIGTIALAGATTVLAIDDARKQQLLVLERIAAATAKN